MPETEERDDGWWPSMGLRWSVLYWVIQAYFLFYGGNWGLRWAHLYDRNGTFAHALDAPHNLIAPYWQWATRAFTWLGTQIPAFQLARGQFRSLVVDMLGVIPLAAIWTIFDRRRRSNAVIRQVLYYGVRCWLATGMFLYGSAKTLGDQGIPQPSPLEWIRPLGEISTGQLMWTWLGYSPAFQFFAGVNESLGAILLLFRRTTLLGALLIVPVMAYVTVLDLTFSVGPWTGSLTYALGALYLVSLDWQRLTRALVLGKPTAPPPRNEWRVSPKLALAGRGLWLLVVAYGLWSYVVPRLREAADIAGGRSPLCGAYRVEHFVSDGRELPADEANPGRWRELTVNCLGDYMRVRRMDDAEMLWAADPGYPYRFLVVAGHEYRYGDYGKLLAKTAAPDVQLKLVELPNYRSPHAAARSGPGSRDVVNTRTPPPGKDRFFTLKFVRNSPGTLLIAGRIDGAEVSADLRRIENSDFPFFRTRGGVGWIHVRGGQHALLRPDERGFELSQIQTARWSGREEIRHRFGAATSRESP